MRPVAGRRVPWRGLAAALSLLMVGSASGEMTVAADDLRAAFIYKLALFVEWPAEVERPASTPLSLCVLGAHDLSKTLGRAVRGKKLRQHELVVVRLDTADGAERCHVLYVGAEAAASREPALERVRGLPILTIGENDRFASDGGVIELRWTGTRLGFAVNLAAAERADLQVSSKLLRLAVLVEEPG